LTHKEDYVRLTTLRFPGALGALALAGVVAVTIVHGQTPQQPPPVQQTPPTPQVSPAPPAPVQQPPTVAPPPVAAVDTTPAPTPVPCPSLPPGLSDVGPILDHISQVVNDALGSPSSSVKVGRVATSGTASAAPTDTTGTDTQPARMTVAGASTNKVTIERDKLDQVRAEIEQLKTILKK
jgi:hypothetical protein